MSPLLEVQNVHKTFEEPSNGRLDVLRGVSLEVAAGAIRGLVGPNGCGKTTLLRIIAGEVQPDGGDVLLCGASLSGISQARRARNVSYVDQDSYKTLSGNLTVGEVLVIASTRGRRLLPRSIRPQLPIRELRGLSAGIAELLERLCNHSTRVLSSGQRQVLGLAVGVLGRPKVLLLDEHLASLDRSHCEEATQLVSKYVKSGQAAALVVNHDRSWINANTDGSYDLAGGIAVLVETL